jgi:hypothetical protein
MSRVLACALALAACGRASATDPEPRLAILGESTRYRVGDALPQTTAWFDGSRVSLVAARGETIGLQIVRGSNIGGSTVRGSNTGGSTSTHAPDEVRVTIPGDRGAGIGVRVFDVEAFDVAHPSTALYGGSHGRGRYADGLIERTPSSNAPSSSARSSSARSSSAPSSSAPPSGVVYIELRVARDAPIGTIVGELAIGEARYPIDLAIASVTLPESAPRVWAYQDPREIAWASANPTGASTTGASTTGANPTSAKAARLAPSADERACAAVFRDHGVLLSPDLDIDGWPARRADFAGIRDVPVVISADPAKAGDEVRAWIAATKGTGHVPFAIPIDEPRTPERIRDVVELGKAIRAAGGGPHTFRFAVTAPPRPEWLGLVDQYIQLRPAPHSGAWQYNGLAPWSGTMILDAETPGMRTWGWIAHRDAIAKWYVWDALYWHDRHNRKGAPLPGRALDLRDPISFDDGEDHGNLDGVLALPGCRPTLRLAALRRGQQDRALLELADACDPIATAMVVARTMPRRGWSTDESVWEESRRELIRIAVCRR